MVLMDVFSRSQEHVCTNSCFGVGHDLHTYVTTTEHVKPSSLGIWFTIYLFKRYGSSKKKEKAVISLRYMTL